MSEFIGDIASPPPETDLTFVQISDSLLMSGDADAKWVDDYYAKVYENMPGYHKPEHYMELPLWIPVISGMAGDRYDQQVHMVTDVEASAAELADTPGTLLFSTIESNAPQTRQLIERLGHKRILMGGHVDPSEFADYPNVTFLSRPEDLTSQLPGLDPSVTPDNRLFAGQEVIPRLTLSRGCLFACEFCMVPRQVTTLSDDEIWKQVDSFKPLGFDLVYLDDKTFGQAPNWQLIGPISEEIRRYNPGFKGFIIQTTANVAAGDGRKQDGHLDAFKDLGVKYTEIGVESVNPPTFEAMVKPYHLKHLRTVMEKARDIGMPIIPNFIFGHPLDVGKYDNVMAWTEEHRDVIPAINVNFLSVLYGAAQLRKQRNLPEALNATDLDQNAYRKSWLTEADSLEMLQAVRGVYYTTSGEDFYPDAYAEQLTHVSAEDVVAGAVRRARAADPSTVPMLTQGAPVRPYWRT
jgi:radical SAM superfamily enzyme YgiQ (UPF0313 family)